MINGSLIMMIATISKGQQITIPVEIRNAFDLHIGSKVEIEKKGNSIVIRPLDEDLQTLFKEAKKRKPKLGLSPKQMGALIEHEIHR